MFKVVLISMYDQGTHGQRSLSAVLKQSGFEVHNVFFGDTIIQDAPQVTDRELQALEHLLGTIRPDLVGLSITSLFCHAAAVAVAARVKARCDVPVIFGGPSPSLLPRLSLRSAAVDYVCVGEGEESVPDLCCRLAQGRSADDVPGIFSRRMPSYVPRDPPADLDALPFPDIDDDPRKYLISSADGSIVTGEPALRVQGYTTKCSRNCPFSCSYCSAPNVRQLASPGKSLRRRSVGHVIAELRRVLELNPRVSEMGFWDDNFPFDSRWVAEFAEQYKTHVGRPFHIWAHPKTVKDANAAALAAAGLKGVILGVESACEETRKRVFLRPESNDDILRADALFHGLGVPIRGYDLIVDHPWESPSELPETFDLLCRLKSPFKVNLHSLILFPETELAKRAVREGRARDEDEIIEGFVAETHQATNKFQWVRQVPTQSDLTRAYWIFLILCLGNPRIPTWFVKLISRIKLIRRHPSLLTDAQVLDMRKENDDFGIYVMSLYRRTAGLGRVFRSLPWLERVVAAAMKGSTPVAITSYIFHRLASKVPQVLLRRVRPRRPLEGASHDYDRSVP